MSPETRLDIAVLESDIPKIRMYSIQEEKVLNKIKTCLNNLTDCYQSKRATELINSNSFFVRNFSTLVNNRLNYITIMQLERQRYELIVLQTTQIFAQVADKVSKVKK